MLACVMVLARVMVLDCFTVLASDRVATEEREGQSQIQILNPQSIQLLFSEQN